MKPFVIVFSLLLAGFTSTALSKVTETDYASAFDALKTFSERPGRGPYESWEKLEANLAKSFVVIKEPETDIQPYNFVVYSPFDLPTKFGAAAHTFVLRRTKASRFQVLVSRNEDLTLSSSLVPTLFEENEKSNPIVRDVVISRFKFENETSLQEFLNKWKNARSAYVGDGSVRYPQQARAIRSIFTEAFPYIWLKEKFASGKSCLNRLKNVTDGNQPLRK